MVSATPLPGRPGKRGLKRLYWPCLALLAGLWCLGQSGAAPVSLKGRIVKDADKVWFMDESGRKYNIDHEAGIFFKYTDYRLEVMDPVFPSSESIRFVRYRILESDLGEIVNSNVRQILSPKNKLPAMDFRVQQAGTSLRFTLYLANRGDTPIRLRFPSSQKYDFLAMTPDEKTLLWRWSWGRNFDLGFNDLVLSPNSELSFSEKWEYLKSYLDDGEYVAYAEVHCLPHGILSEKQRFIIQADRQRVVPQPYFLPLEQGNSWTYQATGSGTPLQMTVTGEVRLDGRDYRTLTFFPDTRSMDENGAFREGDSRLVRFDKTANRYVEWTPQGEIPLLSADDGARIIPADGPCRTPAGQFDNCLEYRVLRDKKWEHVYTIVPGIGLVWAGVSKAGGPVAELALSAANFSRSQSSPVPQVPAAAGTADFRVLLRRKGGIPPEDRLASLRSNGTLVVMERGELARQTTLPVADLWALVQAIDQAGFFQLQDRYGENDIDDPLEIELEVVLDGRTKRVTMRTSVKDKPPAAFWQMVEQVERLVARNP